jgi:DNA-binding NarL/FixJ family response regulator
MNPIRIVLAEDHALVRAGIRALLHSLPGIEVVGEAADGRSAVRTIADAHPDVTLMDISMPELNGIDAIERVMQEDPEVRIIVLSMHDTEEHVWRALQAGASGYLLKDALVEELEFAIRAVARGGSYLSPTVSRHVLNDYVRRIGDERGNNERLTPRQREIVQLVAEGHTNHQIAEILGLSIKTIQTHRATLMDRLGIHDVAGIVRYAIRAGLVSSEG